MLLTRAVGLLAILAAPVLQGQELAIELDASKTRIDFVLSDVLHTVRGAFRLKAGHVAFDPSTGVITGDVIVDAASGRSGSATRDRRMTRDILEVQRYPEIRFTPHNIAGTVSMSSTSKVEVAGSFMIHGQAHEITIPMQVQASPGEITATGRFIVPYVAWGMKNPSNFLLKVNDKVEIDLTAVGHPER
ncbi:MAG TPA: YceI family protein [Bryobacteraceae bacterium]|jgi:polyisoprenoid-binding protein YceI|nr:YceI family protein [Bryobacteraceae bacterium]